MFVCVFKYKVKQANNRLKQQWGSSVLPVSKNQKALKQVNRSKPALQNDTQRQWYTDQGHTMAYSKRVR